MFAAPSSDEFYKCSVIQQESLTAGLLSAYSVHYHTLCGKGTIKTLQFTIIPQVFYTCSVIQQECFTAVLQSAYSVHDQTLCAKGKMKTLQSKIIPSNVGIIYYKCFVIQQESLTARLLSSYSVHYQILCAKGTKNTLQFTIIPKVFYTCSVIVLSNRNIYIPCTHTPQIVRTTYLIEMSYFRIIHYPIYKTHPQVALQADSIPAFKIPTE